MVPVMRKPAALAAAACCRPRPGRMMRIRRTRSGDVDAEAIIKRLSSGTLATCSDNCKRDGERFD